jgi:hypothetical protein
MMCSQPTIPLQQRESTAATPVMVTSQGGPPLSVVRWWAEGRLAEGDALWWP